MVGLSPFRSAVEALGRSIGIFDDPAKWQALEPDVREGMQAGIIQGFEVAYEQGWKAMRRWLEANTSTEDLQAMPIRELYRKSARAGLIDDIDKWMRYHAARNKTSHTYNRITAQAVFLVAPEFLVEARRLLAELEARNG